VFAHRKSLRPVRERHSYARWPASLFRVEPDGRSKIVVELLGIHRPSVATW
jgi:hypothetical protein